MTVGAIVLAGGTSRRWGGTDKTAALLAGRPVLAHVLDGVLAVGATRESTVVVVAPADHPARQQAVASGAAAIVWVMEDPPGGGPVAGVAAGIAAMAASLGASSSGVTVVVLAGDLPFAAPAVPRLLAALDTPDPDVDAAVGVDADGRRQPLLAAYRLESLRRALDGDAHGRSLRSVLADLTVVEVAVTDTEAFDLDTAQSLAHAETLLAHRPSRS